MNLPDIIDRLRAPLGTAVATDEPVYDGMRLVAADEIERLRAELVEARILLAKTPKE